MASLRRGTRKDGSTYVQVLYRLDGKQSSTSFEDLASASKFQKLVQKFRAAKALETIGTDPKFSALTVREWIEHHIDHLTGLRKSTIYDYRSYLKNDIGDHLGDLPLTALSHDDIAKWMQRLLSAGSSGKTIANKHGFLSSALNAAVRAGHIPSNPAAGLGVCNSAGVNIGSASQGASSHPVSLKPENSSSRITILTKGGVGVNISLAET
jgi:hypothetical protein